ncbi:MAG: hypothetical protein RL119_548, partial [Actinomycetota bacterium]
MVVDVSSGIPAVLHWGVPIPGLDTSDQAFWAVGLRPFGTADGLGQVPVVPLHGDGFMGRPGLQGHRRGGRHWSPRFHYVNHQRQHITGEQSEHVLTVEARDDVAELILTTRLSLHSAGVLRAQVTVTNNGDSPYMVDSFSTSLLIPESAVELGTYAGRWVHEFQMQRFAWPYGAWTSENRSGRSSHEHAPYLWALSSHAGEWQGEVWGVHLAWSGNSVLYAETLPSGQRYIQAGELFQPGEICVDPGETLSTPEVVGVYSQRGLTPASWGYHHLARSQSPRPRSRPRPVHINTWEAVYFDHDFERLGHLA